MDGKQSFCGWPGGVAGQRAAVGRRVTTGAPRRQDVGTNSWHCRGSGATGVDLGAVDALLRV